MKVFKGILLGLVLLSISFAQDVSSAVVKVESFAWVLDADSSIFSSVTTKPIFPAKQLYIWIHCVTADTTMYYLVEIKTNKRTTTYVYQAQVGGWTTANTVLESDETLTGMTATLTTKVAPEAATQILK